MTRLSLEIVHVDQPPEALVALEEAVLALDPFRLGALHILTTSMGSLGLGLAVLGRRLEAEEAFTLSRLDEDYQIERWGRDAEADAMRAVAAPAGAAGEAQLVLSRLQRRL